VHASQHKFCRPVHANGEHLGRAKNAGLTITSLSDRLGIFTIAAVIMVAPVRHTISNSAGCSGPIAFLSDPFDRIDRNKLVGSYIETLEKCDITFFGCGCLLPFGWL
jgi:hypothetical protein